MVECVKFLVRVCFHTKLVMRHKPERERRKEAKRLENINIFLLEAELKLGLD